MGGDDILDLIEALRFAASDLASQVDTNRDKICSIDTQKANYVVGMATVNCLNLKFVMAQNESYKITHRDRIEKMVADAGEFINQLKNFGFGLQQAGVELNPYEMER